MRKIAIIGILALVLLAVLAIPAASAHVTMYFVPQNSNVEEGYCNTTYVEVWANATSGDTLKGGQFAIHYDQSCANITDLQWDSGIFTWLSSWNANPDCWGYGYDMILFTFMSPLQSGDTARICTLTVHCNSTEYCETNLDLTCGRIGCDQCPIEIINEDDVNLYPDNATLVNGTFTCGEPSEETFSKDLYEGWNLVSLPLTPSDNSASSVLASVWDNITEPVYRYNATSKQFESATTMDPGEGYFVHVTQNCLWTYSGTPYTSISTELKQGLNMIGWLNCSKSIGELSSIDGKYWYMARWNATAALPNFETFNPVAPNGFNDFSDMERGNGYFISAKEDTTLIESC